eukprot:CAMPEP_0185579736 /NCGR_PEP_ID=MMETSP0434-20130131/15385_1 /TAXON_ID=626734 ORGANISM="Favella taraikaensis, Strain Fe Narragansett Bay" /NCGR_SAMPLE_ID=MMETSP0434 /ASSEMBLY_ACC=CAM_ASM_000379 /LENGTH=80 /DNA_ID=CAMNT_0028197825 /DNA_START=520 /DNA_END=762 /DNA_ORIENTATION=+
MSGLRSFFYDVPFLNFLRRRPFLILKFAARGSCSTIGICSMLPASAERPAEPPLAGSQLPCVMACISAALPEANTSLMGD